MAYPHQLNNHKKRYHCKTITTLYLRIEPLAGQDRALRELRCDDIRSHFSAFGDVKSVRLRKRTKRPFGFVKFTQPESAAKALQTKIRTIAKCRVEINVANDRYQTWGCLLLDLNDDCLLEILSAKSLSVWDLCSLAETSRRLKELTGEVFRRKWTNYRLNGFGTTKRYLQRSGGVRYSQDNCEAKRILINFGSVLTNLQIHGREIIEDKREDILDCVTRYCSDNLNSLIIYNFNIPESFADKLRPIFRNLHTIGIICCTFEGASKKLFDDCAALVNLIVLGCNNDIAFIPKKTFPKLKCLEFDCTGVWVNLVSFLSRHQNLRVLKTKGCNEELTQSIADNCKQLEQLHYNMTRDTPFDFSNVSRLRELKISFAGQRLTNSPGWINLNFLVKIELVNAIVDPEFVRLLPQLKELRVLVLWGCSELKNLNQLDDTNQLTKLAFKSSIHLPALDRLIQHLGNLDYLVVEGNGHELDEETYLKIVKIVGSRNNNSKLTIEFSIFDDGLSEKVLIDNKHIVDVNYRCLCCDYYDNFD